MKYAFTQTIDGRSCVIRVKDQLSPPEILRWDITAVWCVIRWEPLKPVLGDWAKQARS